MIYLILNILYFNFQILFRKEYYKPNEFKRMRRIGYDTLMKTPQGRLKIMKKYLERNPYLGEAM